MVIVKCPRCKGKGTVAHRTARLDARCFCCEGVGTIQRKPPTKRATQQDYLDTMNERIAALFSQ